MTSQEFEFIMHREFEIGTFNQNASNSRFKWPNFDYMCVGGMIRRFSERPYKIGLKTRILK